MSDEAIRRLERAVAELEKRTQDREEEVDTELRRLRVQLMELKRETVPPWQRKHLETSA